MALSFLTLHALRKLFAAPMLENLHLRQRYIRRRESSYDRNGGNRDAFYVAGRTRHQVREMKGPGIIRHLWFKVRGHSDLYRKTILTITFDGAVVPQVSMPLSDFFLFGHGKLVDVNAGPIQVWRQRDYGEKDPEQALGSLNCTFPMPFAERCVIEIENAASELLTLAYVVDWERHIKLSEQPMHFHATLNEERTQLPVNQEPTPHGSSQSRKIINQSDANNYELLDVGDTEGHYVGTALSVACHPDSSGSWWDGDDMFVIDDEPWPPRLHGVGTAEYFNLAWGIRNVGCRPDFGVTYIKKDAKDRDQIDGLFSLYRFHIADPIPFSRSLRATIEHGHANDCNADYRSVAYWYGRSLNSAREKDDMLEIFGEDGHS